MSNKEDVSNIKIIEEFNENQIEDLYQLFVDLAWWNKGETRTIQDLNEMIKNSQINLGLINQKNQLIGYARVVTDMAYQGDILDVMIAKKCDENPQFKKKLVDCIVNHEKLKKVKNLNLVTTEEQAEYYKTWDFNHLKNPLLFMTKE